MTTPGDYSVYIKVTNRTNEILHLVNKSSEPSEPSEYNKHMGEWVTLPDKIPPGAPVSFKLSSCAPFEGSTGTFTYTIGEGNDAPRFKAFQTCPFGPLNRVEVESLPKPYAIGVNGATGTDRSHIQPDGRVPTSGWPLWVDYVITEDVE
ncbi:unnamed protein product [Rhizoctonia solani]|uniref:Uncharacterized protein n=1 Tax=Rhizoctonia solani TaxID=456999 RepID=A0A8H3HB42_9AGAM|nr:unnamed protein product [Rhizoctonia solani]